MRDVKQEDGLRVLDYDGHHIFRRFLNHHISEKQQETYVATWLVS
jgi:hypothetical protein